MAKHTIAFVRLLDVRVLAYQGMNCKFFCTSLYCNTAKRYNSNPCRLTIHSPEHEYLTKVEQSPSFSCSLYLPLSKVAEQSNWPLTCFRTA
jgi:hypothetical protein